MWPNPQFPADLKKYLMENFIFRAGLYAILLANINTIVVIGVCGMMIIWIIATYIPSGICLLRVGSGGAGAGSVVCFGFAMNTS